MNMSALYATNVYFYCSTGKFTSNALIWPQLIYLITLSKTFVQLSS